MKNLLIIATLFLVTASPIAAQEPEPYHLYLPLVTVTMTTDCERTWRIIQPDGVSNEVLNPSAETTGNFAGAAATRSTTYSHYGLYSYRLQTVAGGQGVVLTTAALANATHYVTLRVRGATPPAWALTIGATIRYPRLIEAIDADWSLYGARFTAAECNGQTSLSVTQAGAGSGDFYADGVQVEANAHWTTYVDGTQGGCKWNGVAHAATSTRSGASRAGGRVRDLWADYGFFVEEVVGVGAAPETISTRSYAILPGGVLSGSKVNERNFTLIGRFVGESEADLHQKRQELLEELAINTYPESQAVRLRFSGATVQKQIAAYYTGGLEAQLKTSYGPWQVEGNSAWRRLNYWTERTSIQFMSPDPLWREVGESSALLDTNDSATFNSIAGRLRSTGQWDNLNVGSAPGTSHVINTIIEGPDKKIHIGGGFTDWNGVVGRDYIAAYDPAADSWETIGNLTDFNGSVHELAFGPDGTLYAVGVFTDVAGAGADYIAQWDGNNWTAVGDPDSGTAVITAISAIAFDTDGNLYVGGVFTNLANIDDADYFAEWNGTSWSAVGSGGTSGVNTIAIDSKNNIYIGGSFANWAGVGAADLLAVWDGTSWAALNNWSYGGGFQIYDMLVTEDDTLYVCGDVTDMGGVTDADYVAGYNGTSFFALGEGVDDAVLTMDYYNGSLYVAGSFGALRYPVSIDLPARVAKWNGASWSFLDAAFPLTANHYFALAVANPDPVVSANIDIYVGTRDPGISYYAGIAAVVNPGTARAYPAIKFTRSGGTSARIFSVRNEAIGKELLMYYSLQNGEVLTVDLSPTSKSVVSSFYGSRLETILANSDFGSFALQPGNNSITSFVNVAGDPTVVGYLLWKSTFLSLD